MNWIKKTLKIGEKIKKLLKTRPTKQDIENSDWTSCCKGPVLKKDLEDNLWICQLSGKHHRINCKQRFDIFFGKNNYEVLSTPIPLDDPLEWKDSKTYLERLKEARKKTGNTETDVLNGGINNEIKAIAMANENNQSMIDKIFINLILFIKAPKT